MTTTCNSYARAILGDKSDGIPGVKGSGEMSTFTVWTAPFARLQ